MGSAREQAQRVMDFRFELGQLSFSLGGLVAAALTLAAVWLLSRAVQRAFVRHAGEREARSRAAIYTVSRLVSYALYTIGLMVALSFLGIPTSQFAVLAGALGVGLGFGLQAIFSNFISGIILLFDRSLRVGDFVELGSGLHGEVRDINIRSTLIATNDNIDILVPNSEFVTGRVVNWTHGDMSRRLRVPFGVAYGSDKELVKKAALEAAAEVPFTLTHEGPRRPAGLARRLWRQQPRLRARRLAHRRGHQAPGHRQGRLPVGAGDGALPARARDPVPPARPAPAVAVRARGRGGAGGVASAGQPGSRRRRRG